MWQWILTLSMWSQVMLTYVVCAVSVAAIILCVMLRDDQDSPDWAPMPTTVPVAAAAQGTEGTSSHVVPIAHVPELRYRAAAATSIDTTV